jgi:hypothetical protein
MTFEAGGRGAGRGMFSSQGVFQDATSVFRDDKTTGSMLLKGAVFRGGVAALALAWGFGRYHARKHALLRAVRRGAHAELVRALEEGRLRDLQRMLP